MKTLRRVSGTECQIRRIQKQMKLFLKILFFIFTMIIITVGETKASTVVIVLQEETSYSFIQKTQFGAVLFENHNTNSWSNERNVVACSERAISVVEDVAKGGSSLVNQIDNSIAKLSGKAKYILEGTGEYGKVGGHHPLAKVAFEGDNLYKAENAFSVSRESLGGQAIHDAITGQQRSLYTAWKKANPNAKLTIDDMGSIEIQAMKNAGIPEDVATGWVIKALEDIKRQGVTEIKKIPWGGMN